ncbi:MAG: hypothetical protein Q8Q08_02590 [Candidatus Omnitrophota bacterium]|nr:hypothetical protein [Candidatus Omnitrophota bacterium]MDZ4243424.1 hypothetical protein [Candidatus Omnitrophota bacterium]
MKILYVIIIFCFCAWLLPLGIFVSPSKEDKVCGGRRAVCLCTHASADQSGGQQNKGVTLSKPGIPKDSESSGGSHFFLRPMGDDRGPFGSRLFDENTAVSFQQPFLRSIEHVPKA